MSTKTIQVVPTGGALGAEIKGVDLSQSLTQSQVVPIRRALLECGVIFFRRQQLSAEDQVRFTNYFGRATAHVREQPNRPVEEIFIISNVEENGRPIGALGNGEIDFHSDLSYMRRPGVFSLLYAVEVAAVGGDTQWCNCRAAYAALAADLKERLGQLRAVHRHPIESQNPPEIVDHPVVCTHPETGSKSLYVSPHLTRCIAAVDAQESDDLLDALFAHVGQERFIWTHRWQVGDLVMWDNRFTMHRRLPFPPEERRVMMRTQIFGEEIPQP